MKITIVGESLARKGTGFTYLGETDEGCGECKLRKVCHDLEPNRPYRVTGVRPMTHKGVCHVFEGASVHVVEVEPVPLEVAIPVTALRGTGWSKRWDECGAACRFKPFCNPAAVPEGAIAAIGEVGDKVDCKVGRDLRFATVEPKAWTKG